MSLVIKRRPRQQIVIGKREVVITFHRIDEEGFAVFGIDADKSIDVNRLEVYESLVRKKAVIKGLPAKK